MGHIVKTPAGTFRANWRDDTGRQKAKNFRTKKEAAGFLAQVESAIHRGLYVDPHAGRQLFGPYAEKWLSARSTEMTTANRDLSMMRTHILPRWQETPLGKIDHSSVQQWAGELATKRAPATVTECVRLLSGVLRSAVRDRIIGQNPCEGVRIPKRRKQDHEGSIITPTVLRNALLPEIPHRYRALVAVAGGTGLRWGECLGLRWSAIDMESRTISVVRVMIEVSGHVTAKPYPKSRAGRRSVPIPGFVYDALVEHQTAYPPGPGGEVFTNQAAGPLRRSMFRRRTWRPALVRAGLLGRVEQTGTAESWSAAWPRADGSTGTASFPSERQAVAHVVREADGGLRFHDLRHSYATWLVSRGLPVNDVQRVMGHENPSTTLALYTHQSGQADERVRDAFADDPLTNDE
ncbi:tyrosine-type recombinase/integrase [Spongisporangium articulatum]|uniref:Tyrosine-type recombinase/integrase n=1 Tax=Spongisporangium articulatum TaxID=3362603 RepID=A0ABW8AQX8_9ACTN